MDRITNDPSSGSHSHPVSSNKITDLQYDIAVGRRCSKCKKFTEKCRCKK